MRIERCLHASRDPRQRFGFRRDHVHRGAQRFRRAHQHPGAAGGRGRRLDGGVRRDGGRSGDPDQATAPVEIATRTDRVRQCPQHGRPGRRAHRYPPDGIGRFGQQRRKIADRPPHRARRHIVENLAASAPEIVAQPGGPIGRPTTPYPRCVPAPRSRRSPRARQRGRPPPPAARRRPRRCTASRAPRTAPPRPPPHPRPAARPCRTASGAGSTFKVTSVMTPSVP